MQDKTEPKVWLMHVTAIDQAKVDSMILRDRTTGVLNREHWRDQWGAMWERFGIIEGDRRPVPPFEPPIILNLPVPNDFDLDFFDCHSITFCSARFRQALALPPSVVQYVPVDVRTPDPRIRAMDYRILRVLACQPALDTERLPRGFHTVEDRYIGGPLTVPNLNLRSLKLLPDLCTQTELFRPLESDLDIYATDQLAQRVMRAGCLGVEFRDPEYVDFTDLSPTIRTADGVAVSSPATRRAHLRVVKRMQASPVSPGV